MQLRVPWGSLAVLLLLCTEVGGEASKRIEAKPCPASAEPTLKVQVPAPPAAGAANRQPDPSPAPAPATNPKPAAGAARASKDRIPTEAEFRGPRATWERLGLAIRRGDKDAALRELTPSARERLAPVFDTIGSKSTSLKAEDLGSIRSVTLAGTSLATITLTRKKADGTYAQQVYLMRDADGKWRIDNM